MKKAAISVLIVEDDHVQLQLYEQLIKDYVEKIYTASNGLEGLELYKKHPTDLVITDIRMPLLNGLDMISHIKKINPKLRAIVISAYSDSSFFMQAIEKGVKTYLLKPIDAHRLQNVILEQAQEIHIEHRIKEEEQLRKKAEQNLLKSENILQAVSEAAEVLLHKGFNDESMNYMLSRLGEAANVSRVYLFENFKEDEKDYAYYSYEWLAWGVKSSRDNQSFKNLPLDESPVKNLAVDLSQGETIYGNRDDYGEKEQYLLDKHNIISFVAVPVLIDNEWIGTIGLDDCFNQRDWSVSEINSITTAANIIGAAIIRTKAENQLLKLNRNLEARVSQRTLKLEKENNERKIVEGLLRESEEKYRLIFENSSDGILISSNDKILFMNPQVYELTGYYLNELIGREFFDIVHPTYVNLVKENMLMSLAGKEIPPFDIQLVHKSGKTIWVEMKSDEMLWENKPALLSFLTNIDSRITYAHELEVLNTTLEERVQEELKQREKQQQLFVQKSRLESLGELAAGIAHEINQPLGGLSMSLENMLDELEVELQESGYIKNKFDLMFEDIERIRQIIDQVRMFAREQKSAHRESFDVLTAIQNSLKLVRRLYQDQQIDFQIVLPQEEAFSYGNGRQFEQVVLNVLSNAKHAVSCKEKKIDNFLKQILLHCEVTEDEIILTIRDNGCGIPKPDLVNVFNPFFTTKTAEEGTGLGLSISYGIITDMKGSIEINSTLERGSEVCIKVPHHPLKTPKDLKNIVH